MCSFVIESRVKHCTRYPARNRSDGKQYLEKGGKILSGNKFLASLGFKTVHTKITEVRCAWRPL